MARRVVLSARISSRRTGPTLACLLMRGGLVRYCRSCPRICTPHCCVTLEVFLSDRVSLLQCLSCVYVAFDYVVHIFGRCCRRVADVSAATNAGLSSIVYLTESHRSLWCRSNGEKLEEYSGSQGWPEVGVTEETRRIADDQLKQELRSLSHKLAYTCTHKPNNLANVTL
jgi:hypothetical protein